MTGPNFADGLGIDKTLLAQMVQQDVRVKVMSESVDSIKALIEKLMIKIDENAKFAVDREEKIKQDIERVSEKIDGNTRFTIDREDKIRKEFDSLLSTKIEAVEKKLSDRIAQIQSWALGIFGATVITSLTYFIMHK